MERRGLSSIQRGSAFLTMEVPLSLLLVPSTVFRSQGPEFRMEDKGDE